MYKRIGNPQTDREMLTFWAYLIGGAQEPKPISREGEESAVSEDSLLEWVTAAITETEATLHRPQMTVFGAEEAPSVTAACSTNCSVVARTTLSFTQIAEMLPRDRQGRSSPQSGLDRLAILPRRGGVLGGRKAR
jgi:hypothetical protein